ncbi:MAG: hypothetical protein Q4B70_09620 [Lachnospiraceae bacterium]|nr:hypothetical protein [Lachnospiraceae bacterium]
MAQISILLNGLKNQENSLQEAINALRQAESELGSLKGQIGSSSQVYRNISNRIGRTQSYLGTNRGSVASMKNVSEQVRRIYMNTEKSITETGTGRKNSVNWTFFKNGDSSWFEPQTIWHSTSGWTSSWSDFFGKDHEDSIFLAALGTSGTLFGTGYSVLTESKFGNLVSEHTQGAKWDFDEGEVGFFDKNKLSWSTIGVGNTTQWGLFKSETAASLLNAAISGESYFVLMKDGKFSPGVKLGVEGEASVVHAEQKFTIGTDDLNFNAGVEGDALGVEADASISAGRVLGDDGEYHNEVSAKAGAEAYLVKGEAEAAFDLFGIKIKVEGEAKAGAIGATAEAKLSDSGFKVGAGASALFGLEGNLSVDWSDFADNVGDFFDSLGGSNGGGFGGGGGGGGSR